MINHTDYWKTNAIELEMHTEVLVAFFQGT